MQVSKLFTDDEAVSSVIGVILMVALTVILAGAIASFVLGVGQDQSADAPQATFTFNYDQTDDDGDSSNDIGPEAGFVKVKHDGGDAIKSNELRISGEGIIDASTWGSSGALDSGSYSPTDDNYIQGNNEEWPDVAANGDRSQVISGDFVWVGVESDFSITVSYVSEESSASASIQEGRGPAAET